MKKKVIIPYIATHPGELLIDELNARDIKQKDFALSIDMKVTMFNEIIKGKRNISADTALLLEKQLDIPAKFWLEMQTQYDLDVARIKEKNQVKLALSEQWKVIQEYIPVNYFVKNGYLSDNLETNIFTLKSIFEFKTIDELITNYTKQKTALYKKSEKLKIDEKNIFAWNALVKYKAKRENVELYNSDNIDSVKVELSNIFYENKNVISKTKLLLSKYGIKFIVQDKLDQTPVDGMAFWSENKPAIAITLRKKNIDNMAFAVMHELGHIKLHLGDESSDITILDIDNYDDSAREKEANEFAQNALISDEIWSSINTSLSNDLEIKKHSKKYKINPAIILGRKCFIENNYKVRTNIEKTIQ